jgi:hypothetical protein
MGHEPMITAILVGGTFRLLANVGGDCGVSPQVESFRPLLALVNG